MKFIKFRMNNLIKDQINFNNNYKNNFKNNLNYFRLKLMIPIINNNRKLIFNIKLIKFNLK